jgi:hypothetical protein
MDALRSDSLAGIMVQLRLSAGTHTLTSPMVFDEFVVASEVTLVGDAGSIISLPTAAVVGRQLEISDGTSSIRAAFSLNSTLNLHLEGMTIQGGAASHGVAAVVVHRGLLVMQQCAVPNYLTTSPPHHLTTSPPHHLTTSPPHHLTTSPPHHLSLTLTLTLTRCVVRGVQGTRALHAVGIGGTVEVGGSRFEDNSGGAVVAAAGSQVHISHSVLKRNTAAEGGAISVAGAATTLHLVGTRIALNVATGRGGGLHVAGGVVTLDNRTVLEDNSAPEGHTMQLLGGTT